MPYQNNRGPARYGRNNNARRKQSRRPAKPRYHYSQFIKKAVPVAEEKVYEPTHYFNDFAFDDRLKANIAKRNYLTPTPIQDQSIPHALEGKDVLGIANTGTGKTAAFLLPLIDKILRNPSSVTVLIIAPVRELAEQIQQELVGFTKGMFIDNALLIGGASYGKQLKELSRHPHFVIGTPGRIMDMVERGALPLRVMNSVVLDEVDRMLDMGFVDDVRKILSQCAESRQSLFFSATISPEIERLINTFMVEPVKISVRTAPTSDNVEQDIVRVGYGMSKVEVLHDLLAKEDLEKVLIFGETKRGVERLTDELLNRGFKAESIHGDKTQGQRQRAIENFKRSNVDILIATDVAARGLDIKGVTHVINYDLPQSYEDYTHRIGRTGRAGKRGTALTFWES